MRRAPALMLALILGLSVGGCGKPAIPNAGQSPDGMIVIAAAVVGGAFRVAIRHHGNPLLSPSPVGLTLADRPFGALVEVTREPATAAPGCRGERVTARERAGLRRSLVLQTSACNDGAAFRLIVPARPGIGDWRVVGETTRFMIPRNDQCFGVRHTKFFNSHEGDYEPVRLHAIATKDLYDLPLTCVTGRGGETYALTESNIENYSAAYLTGAASGDAIAIRLTPRPQNDRLAVVLPDTQAITTPWRVMMIADAPERMIGNGMVRRLAAPSRIGDARWVRPGKQGMGNDIRGQAAAPCEEEATHEQGGRDGQ